MAGETHPTAVVVPQAQLREGCRNVQRKTAEREYNERDCLKKNPNLREVKNLQHAGTQRHVGPTAVYYCHMLIHPHPHADENVYSSVSHLRWNMTASQKPSNGDYCQL